MNNSSTVFVGIDAHKKDHQVCVLDPCQPKREFTVRNSQKDLKRFIRRLKKTSQGPVRICYEAGPCGFALQRQMENEGVFCEVVAPSLIPVKPGERIKTDRRDARKLAAYYRQGLLTPVHAPTPEDEAVRGVCRCRDAAKNSYKRACQQMMKFLLLNNQIYSEGSYWTQKHYGWLRRIKFSNHLDQFTLENYLSEIERCTQRVKEIEQEIGQIAQSEKYKEKVGWLRCFRGIDTVTAMVIVSELFSFERFNHPSQLMAYLGLTPSESSSGGKRSQGPITKTGNKRVRRILVEAAWHQRHRTTVSKALNKRREGQPRWAITIADKAMKRLHKRYKHLIRNGKMENVAITAVAREMVGFIWSVLFMGVEVVQNEAVRDPEKYFPPKGEAHLDPKKVNAKPKGKMKSSTKKHVGKKGQFNDPKVVVVSQRPMDRAVSMDKLNSNLPTAT